MRLVADANVLLAAVLGGRARLILENPQIQEILIVEQAIAEVQQYAVHLAREKGLAEDLVLLAVGALPVPSFNKRLTKQRYQKRQNVSANVIRTTSNSSRSQFLSTSLFGPTIKTSRGLGLSGLQRRHFSNVWA